MTVESKQAGELPESGGAKPKPIVLLIEDNMDNRDIYDTYLTLVGYRVLLAADGEEGLRQAFEHRPDLILLDVSIPKMDGWEVARLLKADDRTSRIPILAVTGHATSEHRTRATALGLDRFLTKPIEPRRLEQEVSQVLGRLR
jgi:two-component system cell cycle response regulator DivK